MLSLETVDMMERSVGLAFIFNSFPYEFYDSGIHNMCRLVRVKKGKLAKLVCCSYFVHDFLHLALLIRSLYLGYSSRSDYDNYEYSTNVVGITAPSHGSVRSLFQVFSDMGYLFIIVYVISARINTVVFSDRCARTVTEALTFNFCFKTFASQTEEERLAHPYIVEYTSIEEIAANVDDATMGIEDGNEDCNDQDPSRRFNSTSTKLKNFFRRVRTTIEELRERQKLPCFPIYLMGILAWVFTFVGPLLAVGLYVANPQDTRYVLSMLSEEWRQARWVIVAGGVCEYLAALKMSLTVFTYGVTLVASLFAGITAIKHLNGKLHCETYGFFPITNFDHKVKFYRAVSLLMDEMNNILGVGIFLGHQLSLAIVHVVVTYVSIKMVAQLELLQYVIFPILMIGCLVVSVIMYGMASAITVVSEEFIQAMEFSRNPYEVKVAKSLRSIRANAGGLYYFSKASTTIYMTSVLDQTVSLILL